jgi:nucleotide-binding universal stress UspA family protein
MRTYPNNSPQAAARIVAVATPADGHVEVGDKADCIAEAARWLHCDRIVTGAARKGSPVR